MQTQKQIIIKLFFNFSTRTYYVQLGETLYAVRETIALAIQDREGLEIRHVTDIKEMQTIDIEKKQE